MQETRTCSKCRQDFPLADFHPRYGEKGMRRRYDCVICYRTYQREYARKNRKGVQYYHARKDRPVEFMFRQVRAAAASRHVPFNLTLADIVIPERCPVLGIVLGRPGFAFRSGNGNAAPSVDRMVPALGYVKGNVAVISLKANRLKNNATAAELEAVAAWMRKHGAE